MTKTKSTKRALLMSGLALLLCVSMLVGSTYAWFTDSVTSAGNKIVAGKLDVQLLMDLNDGNGYTDISKSTAPIFGSDSLLKEQDLWEPGKTEVAYLAIKNNGSLALKYKVLLDVLNVTNAMTDVMEYAIVPDAQMASAPVTAWNGGETVKLGVQPVSSEVSLGVEETHYFALVIHMSEKAGNQYQGGTIDFDLTVLATQDTVEADSFGTTYDENATYPLGKPSKVFTEYSDINFRAEMAIPSESPAGSYELVIPKDSVVVNSNNGEGSLKFDMKLELDGEVVKGGIPYTVTVDLAHPFLKVTQVLHNGEPVDNFIHEPGSSVVTFTTDNFSPFEVIYQDFVDASFPFDFEEDTKVEDGETVTTYKFTKGTFVNWNPAECDKSLKDENSQYMVVSYKRNGKTYYNISERASTLFVTNDATATQLADVNGTYTTTYYSNSDLYKAFTAGYRTVYLLPGTYETATTLTVSSDMDIIGLGDEGDVKVKKLGAHSTTSTKPSNRHLFNCTNNNANTYIQVTLRNLTLDASEKNSYKGTSFGKEVTKYDDNAAVQSIRRSMVKCYDLVVIKNATDMSSIAFYVNANNKVDGAYYPAYMYVEDSVINSTKEVCVADASGSGKAYFFYNNLTYADGEQTYAKKSTYIKNTLMDATDWIWD